MKAAGSIAMIGLCALLIWSPLPLGSNRPLFWVINAVVASVVVGLCLLDQRGRAADRQLRWGESAYLMVALGIVVAWMLVQALPLSVPALAHPLRHHFGRGLASAFDAISADPSTSVTTVAQVVPAILLAGVAALMGTKRRHGVMLLKTVVATSTVLAIYGLTALYLGFDQVLLIGSRAYEGSLTATFVGRSSAAAYMAIGLVGAAALLGERMETVLRKGSGFMPAATFAIQTVSTGGLYLVSVAFLLSALLSTGSRAGAVSGIAGLFVVALASRRPLSAGRRSQIGVLLLVAAFLAAIARLSSSLVARRLASIDPAADARFPLYRDTLRMIRDRPILGHGAGTFADVYPLFQGSGVSPALVWNKAHSTYLQAASELGVPAVLLILLVVAIVSWRIVAALYGRREPAPVAVAAAAAFSVVALYSLVDFSIQTQAIGIAFAVIVGAGYGEASGLQRSGRFAGAAHCGSEIEPSHAFPPLSRRDRRARRVFLLLLSAGTCVAIFASARLALVVSATPRSDWLVEIPQLVPRGKTAEPATSRRAEEARELINDPALVTARLGPCNDVRIGARQRGDTAGFDEATRKCLAILDDALGANPLSGELWLERARLLVELGGSGSDLVDSLTRAYEAAPRVGWLAASRVIIELQAYRLLPEESRAFVRRDLDLVLAHPALAEPLVNTFVGSEVFRQIALPAIEGLSADSQQMFLKLVKDKIESETNGDRH